jgi:hypothetical protein
MLQILMERYLLKIHTTQSYVYISAELFFEKYSCSRISASRITV